MQNSGVTLEVESLQFSTSKDQNPIVGSMPYYGVVQKIWELSYIKFFVPDNAVVDAIKLILIYNNFSIVKKVVNKIVRVK